MSLFIDEVVEENARLKKIIKIIKEKCQIYLDYHEPKTIETLDDYKYISDEEYDLLKEVFGDEK